MSLCEIRRCKFSEDAFAIVLLCGLGGSFVTNIIGHKSLNAYHEGAWYWRLSSDCCMLLYINNIKQLLLFQPGPKEPIWMNVLTLIPSSLIRVQRKFRLVAPRDLVKYHHLSRLFSWLNSLNKVQVSV